MTAYLFLHPPATPQFRPRRAQASGAIVVHTTENAADIVGLDTRAEQVAKFISARSTPGSYHLIVDSDSWIQLVPFSSEAFGEGTGGNPWAIHISFACYADEWSKLPDAWVRGAMEQARLALEEADRWLRTSGSRVVAKRITPTQYRDRQPGFVSHGELDPFRRHDPGPQFPWATFFDQLETPQDMYQRIVAAYLDGGRPPTADEVHTWMVEITRSSDMGEPVGPTLDWITWAVKQEGA